jgi:ABC-type glycerol-3-phosphate transport system substrate-binding protein
VSIALVAVAALVVSACGGGADEDAASTGSDTPDDLTGITMTDVATGDEVVLTDALDAPAATPVLAAFWAPH